MGYTPSSITQQTATIAAAGTVSSAINVGMNRAARLSIPAAWTAANLNVQVSADGVTYQTLYNDDGTIYTITVTAADTSIVLGVVDFLGITYFKLVSTAAQGAARDITVISIAM